MKKNTKCFEQNPNISKKMAFNFSKSSKKKEN